MKCSRVWRVSLLLLTIFGAMGTGSFGLGVGRTESPPGAAVEASPSAGPDCTAWKNEETVSPSPDECTASSPWWTAWASCAMTPIHNELWLPSNPADGGLSRIPWIKAEPERAGLVGHLFYGNRPLSVGGEFPDESAAKVLWEFEEPVSGLSITANNLVTDSPLVVLQEAGSDSSTATQWPSLLSIPTAGCWRVNLAAVSERGNKVTGAATFIVIDE